MLVLSRKKNQEIVIGKAGDVLEGPIVITQLGTRGENCRIGVTAPRSLDVHRMEVLEAIQEEKSTKRD